MLIKINIDTGFFNVLVLSWGFMFTFAAFQTMTNIEKSVLDAITKETPNFTGDGYISLAIIYAAFGVSLFLSPAYSTSISTRLSILIGAICNVFFLGSFFWPEKTLLYIASAIQGTGNTLIWIGSGRCITENSKSSTISRNSGIFWATFQFSLVIGNLFVYFAFIGTSFDRKTRKTIFVTLTILALIGCAIFLVLRKPLEKGTTKKEDEALGNQESNSSYYAAWLRMKSALILVITPNMLLLSITFLYTGLVLAFYSGVYTSCVGFTVKIGESRKKLVSLTGVAIGIGEGIGATLSGPVASKIKILSSSVIIGLGFLGEAISFAIAFVNFPNNAPFQDTEDIGFITPSPILAIVGGIFLGFGDSCFNTQIYNILATLYKEDIATAFAFFCFCQSITVTLSFIGSNYVGLYVQLIIFFIIGIFGTACFIFINLKTKNTKDDSMSVENNTQRNQIELENSKR